MRNKSKIGVLGAMDSEIKYLVDRLENMTTTELCGYLFYSGERYEQQVTILKCGIGKVNAARRTQLLIDHFVPNAILNTGIAGALDPALHVGDAVIATGFVQHDFDVTAFGHATGYLCTGVDHDKPTVFWSDNGMIRTLTQAAKRVLAGSTAMKGLVATGDIFVANAEVRSSIRKTFNAVAVEMEGAAIAQVASYAGIPFAALRVISDNAESEAVLSFDQFEVEAAKRSADVIEELLKQL